MTTWGSSSAVEETKQRERSRSREKATGSHAFGDSDQVALKLRGVPFRASESEVEEFFADYKLVAGSIKFETGEDGRKTGFAAALFESEDQANSAREGKDKQTIGTRWIGLSNLSYSDYQAFGSGSSSGGGRQQSSSG
jgi:RNA recognition motif-containing protein